VLIAHTPDGRLCPHANWYGIGRFPMVIRMGVAESSSGNSQLAVEAPEMGVWGGRVGGRWILCSRDSGQQWQDDNPDHVKRFPTQEAYQTFPSCLEAYAHGERIQRPLMLPPYSSLHLRN
jgi:hypothetical protein